MPCREILIRIGYPHPPAPGGNCQVPSFAADSRQQNKGVKFGHRIPDPAYVLSASFNVILWVCLEGTCPGVGTSERCFGGVCVSMVPQPEVCHPRAWWKLQSAELRSGEHRTGERCQVRAPPAQTRVSCSETAPMPVVALHALRCAVVVVIAQRNFDQHRVSTPPCAWGEHQSTLVRERKRLFEERYTKMACRGGVA